jgi:protein-tyrosine phosphatase/arsenate reductase
MTKKLIFQSIKDHCDKLVKQFDSIPEDRKTILKQLSSYIQNKLNEQQPVRLIYVCTHNSRRSHFGQVWAAVAAVYFHIENVHTFSGGTETMAFNPNAISALRSIGFIITKEREDPNPLYKVQFGEDQFTNCFSKVYNNIENPTSNFAAIMTCSDAEENCPFIPGVEFRISTTYDDPKAFDGTPQQEEKYLERSNQIALECLYVFSLIPNLKS